MSNNTERHFLARLFADTHEVVEVESRDVQIAAVQEETGRNRILTLGGFSTNGEVFAQPWPNHRPGSPMPGLLIVVSAASDSNVRETNAPPQSYTTFAENGDALLDQLNALELEDGLAVLIKGNGSTFVRQFAPKDLPVQSASLEGKTSIDDSATSDQVLGDLLAGQPDIPPAGALPQGADTGEGTGTEIDSGNPPAADAGAPAADASADPATGAESADASTSGTSGDPAQDATLAATTATSPATPAQGAADSASTPASGRKGRSSNYAKEA